MIISHQHEFIFLKTAKTAGTSIEIALSKFCGRRDVITPITPKDEETRRSLGYRGPQNYLSPIWDYRRRDFARLVRKGKLKERFYNHMSAREIKAFVGDKVWGRYFKFCFERNPWDRAISLYYWQHRSRPEIALSEFIMSEDLLRLKERGFDVYSIDGEVAVDRVCRFENLSEELEAVRTRLGLPEELVLPRAKSEFRKDKRSYREILGERERARIAELCSEELKLFNYEF